VEAQKFTKTCLHGIPTKLKKNESHKLRNVDVMDSVAHLNRTPMFEWYVVRCAPKNNAKRHVLET
jgi:hypothetical protein